MSDCQPCISAERDPQIGMYFAGCPECCARQLAQGTDFWDAQRLGLMTAPYRAALERNFGEDWQQGHARVKVWAKKIKEVKA